MKNKKDNFFVERMKSIGYAFKGVWLLITTENSIKTHMGIIALITILGFVMEISTLEWIIQILVIGLILVAEALNTGFEKMANYMQPEFDKKIGTIKDISAGAVAFAVISALVISLIIYIPKFV